jgi:hypothetical protein
MENLPIADVMELEQLLARYAVGMTKDDVDSVMGVFTPDGTYSAFGDKYELHDFPTRSMTFLRKSGARDSGRPHDLMRPAPSTP